MARPVDDYIKDNSFVGDVAKRKAAAEMSYDKRRAEEAREAARAMESKEVIAFAKDVAYKAATGMIKTLLEQGYVADALGPDALKWRVVTYSQDVLGVNDDATLAMKKDAQGNPVQRDSRYLTINGYLDQSTVDAARSALFVETSVPPNRELFQKILAEHSDEVKEAFKDGVPLMFTPKRRENLTDLLK